MKPVENAFTKKPDLGDFFKDLRKAYNKSKGAVKARTPAKEPKVRSKK